MFSIARGLKFMLAALFVAGFFVQTSVAQQTQQASALPEAPAAASGPQAANPSQAATGTISGTVLDTNRNVLEGVRVTVRSGAIARTAATGSNGEFVFDDLPSGTYSLTATQPQMLNSSSAPIVLPPNGSVIVPPIVMTVVAAGTSITVNGNKEALSVEQVQIAEQQRVFGVIPNFYTSFVWNAPPMLAKQKYRLALRSLFDPVSLVAVAGIAGAEQYENIFPAYGSGIVGYGKRYGAAFANRASGEFFGRAVYPAIFHQDPRYFYKGKGSFASRALYAISAAVIAHGDNGHLMPNYSAILGNLTAGAISNLYYPQSDRGASLVFYNALADTGATAAGNLIREFVLRNITSHLPGAAHGQP